MQGGIHWIEQAITDDSLLVVTDGSYMQETFPNVCLAAFILECTKGRGRLIGHYPEKLLQANAYRGKLLGLVAIHLLLLSVNHVAPALAGSVQIFSDCLGALNHMLHLPPHQVPTHCKHSDILKTSLSTAGIYPSSFITLT